MGRVKRNRGLAEAAARQAAEAAPPACALCDRPLGTRIEWHHVVPRSEGGTQTAPLGICRASAAKLLADADGPRVAVLEQQSDGAPAPTADGQVTSAFDRTLVVLVADCTPVLIYDREQPLVAAVHAGRPGMLAAVVPETVRTMRELGSGRLGAVVGPSVCSRCYEVPAQMRDDAAARVPASYAVSWTGTPAIDVAAGVVSQLRADDVELDWIPGCTREEGRLYSHRRDPGAGRFAGVVTLRRRA